MSWKLFLTACLSFCLFIISGVGCQGVNDNYTYSVELDFTGPDYTMGTDTHQYAYVAWIEDSDGTNLQNLYLCERVIGANGTKTLHGTALPYWHTTKYDEENPDDYPTVDGVTGASTQVSKTVTRNLKIDETTEFRVCFEIDRSKNENDSFTDRPAFIYKSGLITLSGLEDSYPLTLVAYMPNDTLDDYYDDEYTQLPKDDVTIPGFEAYAYLTSLSYIWDSGEEYSDDLVTGLTARIIEN